MDREIKNSPATPSTADKAIQPFFPFATCEWVTTVTTIARMIERKARNRKIKPRALANSLPTELFFSQCGHLASWLNSELNKNVSPQCPQLTRHIPGTGETSLVVGFVFTFGEYRTMIFWHAFLGQEIFCAVALHISKQLQGHLMYFWPAGGSLIGYSMNWDDKRWTGVSREKKQGLRGLDVGLVTMNFFQTKHTVASLQLSHLTTCWSFLLLISMFE